MGFAAAVQRVVVCLLAAATSCSSLPREDEGAVAPGRIWSVKAGAFVAPDVVRHAARETNLVLLGETHDNLEHHRLQRDMLAHLVAQAHRPALVMEQFDREFQSQLDAERIRPGRSPDAVLDAGRFNRRSWQVDGYRPLVELALEFDLPIVAGNLSRNDARAIVRDPKQAALPPVDPRIEQALGEDITRSHCGDTVEPGLLAGMVAAQRARDLTMAQALTKHAQRGAVLIAGAGHVRADRGAPLYLATRPLVIAFVEIDPKRRRPQDYFDGTFAVATSFDYLWFTSRAERADPCANPPALSLPGSPVDRK
jgi:uncharacterized iron-regulated protein